MQENHNVITAKIDIDEEINLHKDNGRRVAILSRDLSAAYDMVNHPLLLNKFEHIGNRGTPLGLITSFLEDRQFYVEVQGFFSQTHKIPKMSVIQGAKFSGMFLHHLH